MKANPLPPVEYLNVCFSLDRDKGALTWKTRPPGHFYDDRAYKCFNTKFAGNPAGCLRTGYLSVHLGNKSYWVHRIVWKMVYGTDPVNGLDHINGDRTDNRPCNLRVASHAENARNQVVRVNNRLQVKGVQRMPHGKFRALIKKGKKMDHIGCYATVEEAQAAFQRAARELHGEFYSD